MKPVQPNLGYGPCHDRPAAYFGHARREIEPLLPAHAAQVLEVGCGSGATLQWLQQAGRCTRTVGIEAFEDAAQRARTCVDTVLLGNAEELVSAAFAPASFDLVLCLDVLEHLVDPWSFMVRLPGLLKPGGCVLASIPNVRHARVVLPLLLKGRWRYESSGQLDSTHLRFFTRESALQLMAPPGLRVQQWQRRMPPAHSRSGLFNAVTLGLFRDFLAMNYLIAARRE
jgi:2-polyprenyl-3-methyl-5-hydroxy-6-metoxy-1,4-benzoquinol methylase